MRVHRNDRRRGGFSLVELLVVITIIGILAGIVGVNVFKAMREANVTATKSQMSNIKQAIDLYYMSNRRLPDSLEELVEGYPEDSFLDAETVPRDGWNEEFVYEKQSGRVYTLMSLGADKMEGGEGEDADITLEDLRKQAKDE